MGSAWIAVSSSIEITAFYGSPASTQTDGDCNVIIEPLNPDIEYLLQLCSI